MLDAPDISFARIGITIWRRCVYSPLADKIQTAAAHAIASYRADFSVKAALCDREEELAVIIRISEALVDLSANEVNVR